MSNPEPSPAGRVGAALLFLLIVLRIAVSPSIYPWTGPAWNVAALLLLAFLWLKLRLGDGIDIYWPLAIGIAIYLLYPIIFTIFHSLRDSKPFPPAELRWTLAEFGSILLFCNTLLLAGRHLRFLAVAVVTAACLSAVFALRQRLGGFEATLAVDGISEYARRTLLEARVFGLTFSPDMLAATAAAALPLAATLLWLSRRDGRQAWVLLSAIAVALLLTALGLTRSLGGIVAAVVGFGLWLVTFSAFSRRLRIGLLVGGGVAAAAAILAVIVMRGGHLFNFSDWNNPLVLRLDNWRTALAVWREFPFTGAGPGQYGLAMFVHRSLCGNEAKHVHNLLLETLAELGPVGLLGMLFIIGSFLRSGLRESRAPADAARDPLRLAFFASGTAILVHAMMDFSWQTPEVVAMFWVALGAIGSGDRVGRPSKRGIMTGGAIALLLLCLIMGWEALHARTREEALRLGREGKWSEAATASGLMVMDEEIYALRAHAHHEMGDPVGTASKWLRKAITLSPRNPFYYRDLAMWSKDPAERLALMRQSVERYPNSAPLNTLLGRTLLDQGKFAEAEKVLLHAVQICRENGDAMTMLGMLYDRQGKKPEAETWLRRGALAFPPSTAREQILRQFLSRRVPASPVAPAPPAP